MAVLVDTSAWIEFFNPGGRATVQQVLRAALQDGLVVTTAPVVVELLVGLNQGPPAAHVADRLRAIETVELTWRVCERAGSLGRSLARRGQRAPTVDLMIAAAALSGGHQVWHVGDKHFFVIEGVGGPRQRDLTKSNAV